jgi:hypothetical protein
MNLFCLLWTPLFYIFWISLTPVKTRSPAGFWALLLGSAFSLVQFVSGPWIAPGEFGFSRWLSALVDGISLPALLPFLVFALFALLRIVPAAADPVDFALLWLIPGGILRAVSRSGLHDPVFLVLPPLLRTAVVLGFAFFVRIILSAGRRTFLSESEAGCSGSRRLAVVFPVFGILALLPAAAACYWAFFSQRLIWGWIFFALSLLPLACYVLLSFIKYVDEENR